MVLLYTRLFKPFQPSPPKTEAEAQTTVKQTVVPLDEELPEHTTTEYQESIRAVRQTYHLERRMFL